GEVHFAVVEVETRFAALEIVTAPMDGQVDEAVAVEVGGMNVDFVARFFDVEIAAALKAALAVAELEDNAGQFVQPINLAVAIEIDHGVGAALAAGDAAVAKIQSACGRFVEPPF